MFIPIQTLLRRKGYLPTLKLVKSLPYEEVESCS